MAPARRAAPSSTSPTDRWLALVPEMPPLIGPAGTAERILLLLHYGIDWAHGWVGSRRASYWESLLPDRVCAATFRTASLRHWWTLVATELESLPRTGEERRELERLLREEPLPVLRLLRAETPALILRTRIVADAVRANRTRSEGEQA